MGRLHIHSNYVLVEVEDYFDKRPVNLHEESLKVVSCRLFDSIVITSSPFIKTEVEKEDKKGNVYYKTKKKIDQKLINNVISLVKFRGTVYFNEKIHRPHQWGLLKIGKEKIMGKKFFRYLYNRVDVFSEDSVTEEAYRWARKIHFDNTKSGGTKCCNELDVLINAAMLSEYLFERLYLEEDEKEKAIQEGKFGFIQDSLMVPEEMVLRWYEHFAPNMKLETVNKVIEKNTRDDSFILLFNRLYKKYVDPQWEFDEYNPTLRGEIVHYTKRKD